MPCLNLRRPGAGARDDAGAKEPARRQGKGSDATPAAKESAGRALPRRHSYRLVFASRSRLRSSP